MEPPESLWFEYIIKLNDREINRKKASGFTSWSLFGLLSILLYRALDNLQYYSTPVFMIFIVSIFNIIFISNILFDTCTNIFLHNDEENRILSNHSNIFIKTYVIGILILFGYLNIKVTDITTMGLTLWPYSIFGYFFILIPLILTLYYYYIY